MLSNLQEDPDRVFSRVQAVTDRPPRPAGHARRIILSDTTDRNLHRRGSGVPRIARTSRSARIYYRHRPKNIAKKSGNIAEWLQRFGDHYEHMIVLDADSLMTGDTLVRLVAAMEQHPRVGLIQTFPVMVNATTPFARVQQFAGKLYGPLIAHGLAWWHGPDGNYWGHNAILRTRAFAEVPDARPERPRPIGGFRSRLRRAALMRRGGRRQNGASLGGYTESRLVRNVVSTALCQGSAAHVLLRHAAALGTRCILRRASALTWRRRYGCFS